VKIKKRNRKETNDRNKDDNHREGNRYDLPEKSGKELSNKKKEEVEEEEEIFDSSCNIA